MEGFNLTKLPAEVRKLVYDKYFEKLFGPGKRTMMSGRKKAGCGCALGTPSHELATTNIPLARTSRTLKNEVLTAFFEKYVFAFNCACDMRKHLLRKGSSSRMHADYSHQRTSLPPTP